MKTQTPFREKKSYILGVLIFELREDSQEEVFLQEGGFRKLRFRERAQYWRCRHGRYMWQLKPQDDSEHSFLRFLCWGVRGQCLLSSTQCLLRAH